MSYVEFPLHFTTSNVNISKLTNDDNAVQGSTVTLGNTTLHLQLPRTPTTRIGCTYNNFWKVFVDLLDKVQKVMNLRRDNHGKSVNALNPFFPNRVLQLGNNSLRTEIESESEIKNK